MHWSEVLQALFDSRSSPTCLEIGVECGNALMPLRAGRKIVLDSKSPINWKNGLRAGLGPCCNRSIECCEVLSNELFGRQVAATEEGIDVAIDDGLQTCTQACRDVQNGDCLTLSNSDRVIVIHDCTPTNAVVARYGLSPPESVGLDRRIDMRSARCGHSTEG